MRLAVIISFCSLLLNCADKSTFYSLDGGGDGIKNDLFGPQACRKGHDTDGDGIDDDIEGCGPPALDSDFDSIPNYLDSDSDDDGVLDQVEGTEDSDGDGDPDFIDRDSDGDGVDDGDEDLNGDGFLGCCRTTCGEARIGCPPIPDDQCGEGQVCDGDKKGDLCLPPINFLCAEGESDPKSKQTFDVDDKTLPGFICQRPKEEDPTKGLKLLEFKKSTQGGWHLALEKDALYGEVLIDNATTLEAAAAIELKGQFQAVAGFALSKDDSRTDVSQIATEIGTLIKTTIPE